jgi:hypothetical protein
MADKSKNEQALLSFRQARQQALDEEVNFVQGGAVGVGTGLVSSAASVVDLIGMALSNLKQSPGLADKVTEYGRGLAADMGPGAAEGFEAGYVVEQVGEVLNPAASVGFVFAKLEKKVGRPFTEAEKLIVEQASEAKADKIMSGPWKTRVNKVLESLGLTVDDIPPSINLPKHNQSQFPVSSAVKVTDEPAAKGATKTSPKAVGVPSSQHETNPLARSGAPPAGYPNMDDVYTSGGNFGVNSADHWGRGGFDADKFRKHVDKALSARTREAAKGKAGGNPEYWVYDEQAKEIFVVKRDKEGKLFMGKTKGKQAKAVEEAREAVVWDRATDSPVLGKDGKPITKQIKVLNPNIDLVVPSGAKEKIDEMLLEDAKSKADLIPPKPDTKAKRSHALEQMQRDLGAKDGDLPDTTPTISAQFDVTPLRPGELKDEIMRGFKPQ